MIGGIVFIFVLVTLLVALIITVVIRQRRPASDGSFLPMLVMVWIGVAFGSVVLLAGFCAVLLGTH